MDEITVQGIGAALCLAICLMSAIACLLIQIAMVASINSKVGQNERLPLLTRDQLRIFREYRRHFPQSRLGMVFIILFAFVMLGGIGFIFCLD